MKATEPHPEEMQLDMRLVELREVKNMSRIYRWEMMRYEGGEVDVELSTMLTKRTGSRTIVLRLGVHYSTLRRQIRRRLLDFYIETEFEINQVGGLIEMDRSEIVMTPDLMRLMLSIAVGAIRGMLAIRTANTFLTHYPLPVYDLDQLIESMAAAGREVAYNPAAYA